MKEYNVWQDEISRVLNSRVIVSARIRSVKLIRKWGETDSNILCRGCIPPLRIEDTYFIFHNSNPLHRNPNKICPTSRALHEPQLDMQRWSNSTWKWVCELHVFVQSLRASGEFEFSFFDFYPTIHSPITTQNCINFTNIQYIQFTAVLDSQPVYWRNVILLEFTEKKKKIL